MQAYQEHYQKNVHPSLNLPRDQTTDVERQNINVRQELQSDIDKYLRQKEIEPRFNTENSLEIHQVTPALRARMIDWMIEVLTNFKCNDLTFFLAVSLQDRYFKRSQEPKHISDLHAIGVTCMFMASKFEDIYPLKMVTVHEKIAHKKIEVAAINKLEIDILKTLNYDVVVPTVLDFLKVFLVDVLNIEIKSKTETDKKQDYALRCNKYFEQA